MIEIGCGSTPVSKILYDGVELQHPYKIEPIIGEHTRVMLRLTVVVTEKYNSFIEKL